jgi:hypothetical protein
MPTDYRNQDLMRGQNQYGQVMSYEPVAYQPGEEIRYEERYLDQRTTILPQQNLQQQSYTQQPLVQTQFTQQNLMSSQQYPQRDILSSQQYPQQQFIQQRENIAPSYLKEDLTNIEQRISSKLHKPTGYQREREYMPIIPSQEGKMSMIPIQTQTQTIVSQLPGVISNPDARAELGKFVTHQGGTHSTVGSVQSHRIISRMADRPGLGADALDKDARIALGDLPQDNYANRDLNRDLNRNERY